jgi:hypothetical protein
MLEINSTALKEIKLNWNNIKAKGAVMLAQALRSNT